MKKEKFEIKWWEDWINADMLKRLKMVEKLPFVKSVIKLDNKIPEKIRTEMISNMLNGFFEDLESAMRTQFNNEQMKKKKI